MKRVFVLYLAVMMLATGNARVLSPDEALDMAIPAGQSIHARMPRGELSLAMTRRTSDNQPALYVFTGSRDKGFLILSAESNTQAVLAYDGTSPFDSSNLPESFVWWINHYVDQISSVRREAVERPTEIVAREDREAIAPMLSTQWSQDSPYNNYCPEINYEPALTGCVATAMAQVMKYHNWPECGTGNTVYQWGDSLIGYDFSSVEFKWNKMLDRYIAGKYTAEQADAVATLMKACGMATHMQYTALGSGAATALVATALRSYFDYDGTVHAKYQQYYGAEEWESLIYTQLRDYGPVQFAGQSDEVGHSFVCDGYATSGHFHFNWGWAGYCDGYFALSCLEPTAPCVEDVTSGYNMGCYIIANAKPAVEGGETQYQQIGIIDDFTTEVTATSSGATVEIKAYYCNRGNCTIRGYRGVKFTPLNGGDPTFVSAGVLFNIDVGVYYTNNYVVMPSLANGDYLMTPVWTGADGLWHEALQPITAIKAIKATYTDGAVTLAPLSGTNAYVDQLVAQSEVYTGLEAKFTGFFVNDSEGEYRGAMRPMLCTLDNGTLTPVAYGTSIIADVMPDQPEEFVYVSEFTKSDGSAVDPGEYYLVFVNPNGMAVSDPYELTVYDNPGANRMEVVSMKIVDSGGDKSKLKVSSTVRCTENMFQGRMRAYIFQEGVDLSVGTMQSTFVTLSEGDEGVVAYSYDVTSLEDLQDYTVIVRHNNEWISSPLEFTLNKTTGINELEGENAVVRTDVYNLSGMPVTSSELATGFYIIRQQLSDGTVRTFKTIIP